MSGTRDELLAIVHSMAEGINTLCYPKYEEPEAEKEPWYMRLFGIKRRADLPEDDDF